MTLNSSGPISLAGTTAGVSIEVELGGGGTTQISLNDTNVRTLAGVASGAITMPTNFYGKSSTSYWIVTTNKYQGSSDISNKLIITVPNNQNSNTNIYLLTFFFVGGSIPGLAFWSYSIAGSYLYSGAGGNAPCFSSASYQYPYFQTVSDGITAYSTRQQDATLTVTTLGTTAPNGIRAVKAAVNQDNSSIIIDSTYAYVGSTYNVCASYGPIIPAIVKFNRSNGAIISAYNYPTFSGNNFPSGFGGMATDGTYAYVIASDCSGINIFAKINLSNLSIVFSYRYNASISGTGYFWDNGQGSPSPTKLSANFSTGILAVAGGGFSGTAGNIFLSVFTTSGSTSWQRLIAPNWNGTPSLGSLNTSNTFAGTTIDNSGNVYAATWVLNTQINLTWQSNPAIIINKFNSSGTLQWSRGIFINLTSSSTVQSQVKSVTLEPSPTGDIVIAFEIYNNTTTNSYPVLIHYPASGSKYGSTTYNVISSSNFTVKIDTWGSTATTVSVANSGTGLTSAAAYGPPGTSFNSTSNNLYSGGYTQNFYSI